MLQAISKSDVADLRAVLTDAGYETGRLIELLGSAEPPSRERLPGMLHRTRALSKLNALARLFLIGATVPDEEARKVLPHNLIDMFIQTGVLTQNDGHLQADVVIVPVGSLLFASDALRLLGSERAADFVLPASTRAGRVLRHLTLRAPVERTLDLGCGCGLHALLASRHSKSVVATDISRNALRYTEFNTMLNNIENVECREGNLFEPVAGEKFDLIVSNPPFVVGPGDEFTYRDNKLELDEFCRRITAEAPAYLTENGCLQMLCEWVAIKGQPWQDRLRSWTQDNACDTWILRFPLSKPAEYVYRRMSDMSGGEFRSRTSFEEWLDYFEEREVSAVHPGMIAMRRRHGENWFCIHSMPAEPDEDVGEAIEQNMAANDFASICNEDETLLQAVLKISPRLRLEQHFLRDDSAWDNGKSVLLFDSPLPLTCEIDLPALAFLNQTDGVRTVGENIARFEEQSGAGAGALTAQLLPAVRFFVSNGFLEAVDS